MNIFLKHICVFSCVSNRSGSSPILFGKWKMTLIRRITKEKEKEEEEQMLDDL
jgi:hypothetical protein